MAVTDITPVDLVLNTPSATLADAGMTQVTAGDAEGVDILYDSTVATPYSGRCLLVKLEDTTGCTVTFLAGARPPAERAELGATGTVLPTGLDVTIGANEVKYVVLETARFMQSTGKIHFATTTATSASCSAFVMPRNW